MCLITKFILVKFFGINKSSLTNLSEVDIANTANLYQFPYQVWKSMMELVVFNVRIISHNSIRRVKYRRRIKFDYSHKRHGTRIFDSSYTWIYELVFCSSHISFYAPRISINNAMLNYLTHWTTYMYKTLPVRFISVSPWTIFFSENYRICKSAKILKRENN